MIVVEMYPGIAVPPATLAKACFVLTKQTCESVLMIPAEAIFWPRFLNACLQREVQHTGVITMLR